MSLAAAHRSDPAAACSMHAVHATHGAAESLRELQRDDTLVLPMHRRLVVQMANGDAGPELRLYHEQQEVCFDDPAWFEFGHALARHPHFVAGQATTWGAGYDWPLVREHLQQLLDAGVLQRLAPGEEPPPARPVDELARPSPLPPAPAQQARDWRDVAGVSADLTGRALDPAWLELVVPIFRVAHPSVDAEGRQVGEANVFPPALRLDVPTRWRTCIYDGTRHRHDKPMNVAALKSMRAHWTDMMALVRIMRAAYLKRYPDASQGWTVGHVERLSTAVLALPTWLLMRQPGAVDNGALHPALASLFRVTDGVRMVMHQMLFVPVGEAARDPSSPVDAADIHAYAERNYSFHGDHGVCAGPRAMVDEFLATLLDGRAAAGDTPVPLSPELEVAAQAADAALDYGLRGLQAYAVAFSMWPLMVRAYEALAAAAEALAARQPRTATRALAQRLVAHRETARHSSYLAHEDWRQQRDRVYADMLAQCTRGLGEAPGRALAERLAPEAQADDAAAEAALGQAWQHVLGDGVDVGELLAVSMDHLRRTRALLAEAERVQLRLNRHLGRPAPRRALQAADLDLHNQLLGAARRPLPFLADELSSLLERSITVTPTAVDVVSPIGRHGADRDPAHPVRNP